MVSFLAIRRSLAPGLAANRHPRQGAGGMITVWLSAGFSSGPRNLVRPRGDLTSKIPAGRLWVPAGRRVTRPVLDDAIERMIYNVGSKHPIYA
jgi:hypothetical protein